MNIKVKESRYNFFIEQSEVVIYYNSFTTAYLLIHKNRHLNFFKQGHLDLEAIEKNDIAFFNILVANGFIIEQSRDELNEYKNRLIARRFSTEAYHLIINPTMDCNLGCWYCYENHKEKSEIGEDIINHILKHIRGKYQREPFKILALSFFGGEPLLRPKKVKKILQEVQSFCDEKGIKLFLDITTNGTVVSDSMIELFENFSPQFQITIDGPKEKHNSVRYFKFSKKETYELIINNIIKISHKIANASIIVRINYDNDTLRNAYSILDDLKEAKKDKLTISLHRIFQLNETDIDYEPIIQFTAVAAEKGFSIRIHPIIRSDYVCYADNYNQAIINYDGKVFKCTSNDFTNENSEGILDENGIIMWKADKLAKRLYLPLPEECENCKFLPSCDGICSQRILANDTECIHKEGLSIEDIIILNFNYRMVDEKPEFKIV